MSRHEKLSQARMRWAALPEGQRKYDAEVNANDTAGTEEDELRWFEIALGTYELEG